MRSHETRFTPKDLIQVFGPPLAVVAGLVAILQAAFGFGLLPKDRPVHDLEHLILTRQWERSARPADWVVVGDSSALMDVRGRRLEEQLGKPVLQLGTLSLLDTASFFRLAGNSLKANPNPAAVVLLVNPEFLSRPAGDPEVLEAFGAIQSGEPVATEGASWTDRAARGLALDRVRDSLESRLRPFPLRGAYGTRYGFHTVALAELEAEGGLVDPGEGLPKSLPTVTWNLSPRLETAFRKARSALPAGTRILVGITPIPESLAGPDAGHRRDRVLETLRDWIGGDTRTLRDLPVHLPADAFAQKAHLKEEHRDHYTDLLAQAIQAATKSRPEPGPGASR